MCGFFYIYSFISLCSIMFLVLTRIELETYVPHLAQGQGYAYAFLFFILTNFDKYHAFFIFINFHH